MLWLEPHSSSAVGDGVVLVQVTTEHVLCGQARCVRLLAIYRSTLYEIITFSAYFPPLLAFCTDTNSLKRYHKRSSNQLDFSIQSFVSRSARNDLRLSLSKSPAYNSGNSGCCSRFGLVNRLVPRLSPCCTVTRSW